MLVVADGVSIRDHDDAVLVQDGRAGHAVISRYCWGGGVMLLLVVTVGGGGHAVISRYCWGGGSCCY